MWGERGSLLWGMWEGGMWSRGGGIWSWGYLGGWKGRVGRWWVGWGGIKWRVWGESIGICVLFSMCKEGGIFVLVR